MGKMVKLQTSFKALALLGGALLCAMSTAGQALAAESDLVIMHNGSPYSVWTTRNRCLNAMRNNNNKCVPLRACGGDLYSTPATRSVAADKYSRDGRLVIHTRYSGEFCTVQK